MSKCISANISHSQYAYRKGLSTTDALVAAIDDWTAGLDNAATECIQTVMLDFSKAFDRLQPAILAQKLDKAGLNSNIISIISSFLSNRYQCVFISGCKSSFLPINVGTPQGTKLGPILWLFYINDLQATTSGVHLIKYADDSTYYAAIKKKTKKEQAGKNKKNNIVQKDSIVHTSLLQKEIQNAEQWSSENRMLLNPKKSVTMALSLTGNGYGSDIVLNDKVLDNIESSKFLGITIDKRLSFSEHVGLVVRKCSSTLFLLRKLKVFGVNLHGLKRLYISMIRSVLLYGSQAFYTLLSSKDQSRLESVQRSATRVMLPSVEGYEKRLEQLELPKLHDFALALGKGYFLSILHNKEHPLFGRLSFNNCRRSSRLNSTFKPDNFRTKKRSLSFLQFEMNRF